jgi:dephospho-CoA kinase
MSNHVANHHDAPGQPRIVIGAVGLNASGKDAVINRLKKHYGVPTISMGDIARELATKEGLGHDREALNAITKKYIAQYGPEFFPGEVVKKINSSGWEAAGITGVRSPTDVRVFQREFGDKFILVAVEVTDPRTRYERSQLRGEGRDKTITSFEHFLEQDRNEEALFHLSESMRLARERFNNDGTVDDLNRQIDALAARLGLKPVPQEKQEQNQA